MDLLDGEDDEPLLEPARDTQVDSDSGLDEVNINFQVGRLWMAKKEKATDHA